MQTFTRSGLTFDVRDRGPQTGAAVVLLHGFPQSAEAFDRLVPRLHAAGYRTLCFDQRGYSPNARPRGRRAYRLAEAADDVVALLDTAGLARCHLVGHDWGGAVGWRMAARHPDRLESVAVLSTPHPRAMVRSLGRSLQGFYSWYMGLFQLPLLPEWLLRRQGLVRRSLIQSGLDTGSAERYAAFLASPGAARGTLGWYRALPFSLARAAGKIKVPTLYIWGSRDVALTRRAAELTGQHVIGPYRFEVLEGANHWLPETAPDRVAELLLEWWAVRCESEGQPRPETAALISA